MADRGSHRPPCLWGLGGRGVGGWGGGREILSSPVIAVVGYSHLTLKADESLSVHGLRRYQEH